MNKDRTKHFVFIIVYLISGLYIAWQSRELIYPDFGNMLLYGYIVLPFIVSCIGVTSFIIKKKIVVFLWICTIYWLIYCFSEIIEGNMMLPSSSTILVMTLISLVCAVSLIYEKVKRE